MLRNLLGRVLAPCDKSHDLARLKSGLLRRDVAMTSKANAPRPPAFAILRLIGPVAGCQNADAEAFDLIIPNKVVGLRWPVGFNAALCQFRHSKSPVLPLIRGSIVEHRGIQSLPKG